MTGEITFSIGQPLIWQEQQPDGSFELIVKGYAVKEKHLSDRVLEGAVSYDQLLVELLKQDNLI